MNIKSILVRLQSALDQQDSHHPLLFLEPTASVVTPESLAEDKDVDHLIVGYNGSPNSQIALDLTLWIAHQTRLATHRQVMVHVVYVINNHEYEDADRVLWQARSLAAEWRGSLQVHLQIGDILTELQRTITQTKAGLLLLGCSETQHPLLSQLASTCPCPILGIPRHLDSQFNQEPTVQTSRS